MDSDVIQGKKSPMGTETTPIKTKGQIEPAKPITGAYLCSDHEAALAEYGSFSGKIYAQITSFNNAGLECSIETYKKPRSFLKKAIRWLPFTPTFEQWPNLQKTSSYDYIYIRKPVFTKSFLDYLTTLKSINPDILLIMELPTYPYDKEANTLRKKVTLARDRHYRKKLPGLLDRIADLSNHDVIFGIPTVSVINGIDFCSTEPRCPANNADEIHVLSVSGCQPWHGIDRIVRGLSNYYSRADRPMPVFLHLVGDGPELENLKKLSAKLELDQFIRFYGEIKRSDLVEVYDRCSLAFESLGWHRTGVTRSSSIKSREYFAKGIPFVYSCQLDVFEENPVDFCLKIPPDESPVNFFTLVDFHRELYEGNEEQAVIDRIRAYGESHVSIDKAMANVVGYIREQRARE